MAKIKLSFFNVPYKLLCFIGFLYQVLQLSTEYFAFKTSTKTVLQLDHKFINPSIVFCIRYTDIIDRTNYKKYGILPKYRYNVTEMFHDMSKLTIKNVFDLTPDPSEIIIGCQYRGNDYQQLVTKSHPRSHCNSLFHVTKYQEGAFICYQFRTKITDSNFSCFNALLTFYSYNNLYSVSLKQQFLLSNAIKLISFVPSGIDSSVVSMPDISRRFHVSIVRYAHHFPNSSKENFFKIFGDYYSITRLEKPYDTQCTWNKNQAHEACYRRCNINLFAKYGYFPSTEYSITPKLLKHLEASKNVNETILQDIKAGLNNCNNSCQRKLCHDWYSVTGVDTLAFLLNNTITIAGGCSKRPAVIIQYLPRITFMEFVMYVSSSLGIWFGISVMSINPFNSSNCDRVMRRMKTRKHYSYGNESRDFRETVRMAVHDLNRRVRQMENYQLY